MKRRRPPAASPGSARRRATLRFGFSAVIASFVVLGLLVLGAMFQEEYEEGFVRIVSYAVRLASPDELAQAEAAGSPPPPRPVTRPDTPAAGDWEPLADEDAIRSDNILLPEPEILIPIEDFLIETPEGPEFVIPDRVEDDPGEAGDPYAET